MYLSPEVSDSREAWTATSSYWEVGWTIGCVCGGVNNGTLFPSRGGKSTPADYQTQNTKDINS